MITVRYYKDSDTEQVGVLIADTYRAFNLSSVEPERLNAFLGPFQHARSEDPAHREAITQAIGAPMVLVAESEGGEIIGVLRGGRVDERGRTVLQSLFVQGDQHRQGIGRQLVERFEQACRERGDRVIRLASTPFAVPFYLASGYKKSTGLRSMRSFEATGFVYQPMKKVLFPRLP